ncbi:MAG: hypothetical protein QXR58_02910, partial [Candidatus Micrarchaeaceae archaeon]
ALIIIVVLGVLAIMANVLYLSLSSTALMNPNVISNMLANIISTTQLSIIGPSKSLLVPASTLYFPGVNAIVSSAAQPSPSFTTMIDYPLAASITILANMTNQTATNVNNMFNLDAFLGFLDQFTPQSGFCVSIVAPCYIPNIAAITAFWINIGFTPFAGYDMIYGSMKSLTLILTTALESFIAQMLAFTILLYAWPFLLFIGIVLRALFFTRKIGGLFIATAIASVLIFPTVFALEYLSLANGIPSYAPSAYGFNSITTLPSASGTGKYTINFFVEPSIAAIATHNGCYPIIYGHTTLLGSETADIAQSMIPFASVILSLYGKFVTSSAVTFPLAVGCGTNNALHTLYDVLNLYGILGVSGYFLPILNLLIFISSIRGLAGLMGGETGLERLGLSRLI